MPNKQFRGTAAGRRGRKKLARNLAFNRTRAGGGGTIKRGLRRRRPWIR